MPKVIKGRWKRIVKTHRHTERTDCSMWTSNETSVSPGTGTPFIVITMLCRQHSCGTNVTVWMPSQRSAISTSGRVTSPRMSTAIRPWPAIVRSTSHRFTTTTFHTSHKLQTLRTLFTPCYPSPREILSDIFPTDVHIPTPYLQKNQNDMVVILYRIVFSRENFRANFPPQTNPPLTLLGD